MESNQCQYNEDVRMLRSGDAAKEVSQCISILSIHLQRQGLGSKETADRIYNIHYFSNNYSIRAKRYFSTKLPFLVIFPSEPKADRTDNLLVRGV